MAIRVTIANRSDKKLWVKCDYERQYTVMSEFELGGGVGVALGTVGVSGGKSQQYDWRKIEAQFTPINEGSYDHFYFDPKQTSIIYVTILTKAPKEDPKEEPKEDPIFDPKEDPTTVIVCQAVPKSIRECYVVTEKLNVREADKKKHWDVKGYY